MSTKILDNQALKELQPAHGLWELYTPEKALYRFQGQNLSEIRQWQINTRQALNQTLGFHLLSTVSLSPEKIEEVDKGDYIREKILAMHHCPCNFVPGLHKFGEIYDLVGLITPRSLLIEAGSHDPIFHLKLSRRVS
jgi:hypothetical protein